jgi:hypothetical protein
MTFCPQISPFNWVGIEIREICRFDENGRLAISLIAVLFERPKKE